MGQPPQMEMPKIPVPGVKYLVTIGSGKGGHGKTTASVTSALSLRGMGQKVGLLDADVYGPNVPRMMGINEPPRSAGERIQPIEHHELKLMSMGFLSPGDRPVIWRGPMLHSIMQQF